MSCGELLSLLHASRTPTPGAEQGHLTAFVRQASLF